MYQGKNTAPLHAVSRRSSQDLAIFDGRDTYAVLYRNETRDYARGERRLRSVRQEVLHIHMPWKARVNKFIPKYTKQKHKTKPVYHRDAPVR